MKRPPPPPKPKTRQPPAPPPSEAPAGPISERWAPIEFRRDGVWVPGYLNPRPPQEINAEYIAGLKARHLTTEHLKAGPYYCVCARREFDGGHAVVWGGDILKEGLPLYEAQAYGKPLNPPPPPPVRKVVKAPPPPPKKKQTRLPPPPPRKR